MKKSLSFLLAVLMLLTSLTFLASAQEESDPIVFNLVEDDGSIPYSQGRNGECYFPKGSSTINPEVYTWNKATTLKSVDGFATYNAAGNGILEFDTLPAEKSWDAKKKLTYLVFNVKSGQAAKGVSITILAQGARYKKTFPVDFTGEWQQVIFNLNETSGWYMKGDDGQYALVNYSPMNKDGTQVMTGGFRADIPGDSVLGGLTIDYVGLFASEAQAKAYKGRQTSVASGTVDGKVDMPKTENEGNKEEEVPEGTVDIGNGFVFTFIEEDGTIPQGKGRNGDCFFPKGSSTINPEFYTWNTGVVVAENGYGVFYPAASSGMMELDTFPAEKTWTTDKKLTYVGYTVKTSSPAETTITAVAQGGAYKKTFNVKYTGEWQRVVLDLNDTTGWTKKNAEGAYEPISYSPMKNSEGKQVMASGIRLDVPGNTIINSYTFDYLGFFESEAAAKGYKLREDAKSVYVSTGTGAPAAGTTTPEAPKEEEPAEPEKPSMKNALTRGEEPVDNSITLVSAVPATIVEDNKIVYKFANIGTYNEADKKYPMDDEATSYLQTWNTGTFENTSAGVLKFNSSSSGGTLFEVHPKKYADPNKHKYMVLGYKTNEDFSASGSTAYLYTSGNAFRIPFTVKADGEWHYDLYDVSSLDAYTKDSNYAEKAASKNGLSFGAFRIDFPKAQGVVYYIDYLGFFADEAEAKEFIAKSEAAAEADKERAPEDEDKFTYMKGYDDGTFRPGAQMTRAEAATVIARLLADEDVIAADRETAFTDVKKGDWYYGYVTYLEELGFLPNFVGEFKPNQNITRGEFVKLAFEAGGLDFSMKRPNFIDLDNSHPYYQEIVFASGTGIVNGYDNGDGTMSFKPDGEITRAEIATIVNRILKIEATPDAAQEFTDLDNTHWAYGTIMAIASIK